MRHCDKTQCPILKHPPQKGDDTMALSKWERLAVLTAGPVVAVGAAFYAWSANYSALSFLMLKSTAMWKSFSGGDPLMPLKQAWYLRDNVAVAKVSLRATLATLAESAIIAGAVALLIKRPWQVRPPADGSRFATLKDLEAAGLLGGQPGKSVLLGTFGKGRSAIDVRYSGDSHFFVNGPSRSGKGRGFVMPNLLEYQGSVIVLDVKRENYKLTGPARMAMGQRCFVFAPGSAQSHRWNPLDFVRPWPERSTDLINLAATLLPISEKEDGYWKKTARGLLAGILGYVLESMTMEGRRNLRSVLRMFSTGQSFSVVLTNIIAAEPDLDQFILNSFRQHLGRDEEQRPSFEGHVTTALSAFNNLLISEACAASDFDIRDLRRNPLSLFIAAPVSDFGTVEPIIRLLIQQIHDVMLRSLPGKDEPHRILMMLDEFYQFERLPEIIKRAPLVAGYGLTIALVAQNIPQIDERYGQQTRNALLGNMDIKLSIAVGDDATAHIVSDNLGRKYEEREGWGKETGLLSAKKASSGRFEPMPLMDPGAVQRLDDSNTILQVRSGYGAILNKLNFYTEKRFTSLREQVVAFERQQLIPVVKPQGEWPLFVARPKTMTEDVEDATRDKLPVRSDPDAQTSWEMIVFEAARAVFTNPSACLHLYREAMEAVDDQLTADLLHRLRTAPATIAPMWGKTGGSRRGGGQSKASALAAIWPLRELIRDARYAIRDGGMGKTGSFSAGGSDGPKVPGKDLAEEENQLSSVSHVMHSVIEDVAIAIMPLEDLEQPDKQSELARAVANLYAGVDRALQEDNELSLKAER
jgi:type IV secretion system protein VirD4